MPPQNQGVTADRALDGMERLQWPTVASMNRGRHQEAWREANPGNTGAPPIAFRDGNVMRIDFQSLTPEQQQRYASYVTRQGVGDRTVNATAGTQPKMPAPPTRSNGALDRTDPGTP
jgi:hypothetical protein